MVAVLLYRHRWDSCRGWMVVFVTAGCMTEGSFITWTIMDLMRPLPSAPFASIKVNRVEKVVCNCFPIFVAYWCDISVGKHNPCAKNCNAEMRDFLILPVSLDGIGDLRESDERQLGQTMSVRETLPWLMWRTEEMNKKRLNKKQDFIRAA